tara:strand:- start:164 stop:595 length:432 start_codon:yes stop_codon:yes gene_type:complete
MINYEEILNSNLINVFKDILFNINTNGLNSNNHLYVTFNTNHNGVTIPEWLRKKFPSEMTIVIQYEFYNLEIEDDFFLITLSFNNIKEKLKINYNSIISFADPSANFGLILKNNKNKNTKKNTKKEIIDYKNNIIEFSNFKKN